MGITCDYYLITNNSGRVPPKNQVHMKEPGAASRPRLLHVPYIYHAEFTATIGGEESSRTN